MERINRINRANVESLGQESSDLRKTVESLVEFHLRDITNRRPAGSFKSESAALASLQGRPDGHFSINNHQGDWCEVVVRGGNRYTRHLLMVDGSPAEFKNIDDIA